MKYVLAALVIAVGLGIAFVAGRLSSAPASTAWAREAPAHKDSDLQKRLDDLQADLKKLDGLVPDQAAIMSHLAYHFSNLYFAVQEENWPLAEFYLSETRANLKWAVRSKPMRKDLQGKETVNVKEIAEAMDNGPFTQLQKSIAAKDKPKTIELYKDTLTGCYACHKASFKPYLRPQVPTAAEVRAINFDPKADFPK